MKPISSSPGQFHIGSFGLDIQAGELHRSGFTVRLYGQPREILAMQLEHVVTREELMRRLWPDHMLVDFDHGLNRAINKLREAEGDANETQYIETHPRRGYRLIAPVEAGEHGVTFGFGPRIAGTPGELSSAAGRSPRWANRPLNL